MTFRRFGARLVAILGLFTILLAPLEQLVPDDCDGHVPSTPADLTGADHGGGPPAHTPGSAHICHDVHNHTALVGSSVVSPAIPLGGTDPGRVLVVRAPSVRLDPSFRPPIA